jgi:hypothetical protein
MVRTIAVAQKDVGLGPAKELGICFWANDVGEATKCP